MRSKLKIILLMLLAASVVWGFEARIDDRVSHALFPETHPWTTLTPQAFSAIAGETRRALRDNPPRLIPALPSFGSLRAKGLIDAFTYQANPNNWRNACLAWGLEEAYQARRNPEDLRALGKFADAILDSSGKFKRPAESVEQGIYGWVLLKLYEETGDPRYFAGAEELARVYLRSLPRTETGLLPYNPRKKGMFVDSVGMLCPFLAKYGKMAKNKEASQLAVHQIDEFLAMGMDVKSGLPWHAYQDGKPYGLLGWSRGMGWLAVGLAATLAELPPENPDRVRLASRWNTLASLIASEQQENGLWSWAFMIPDAAADSSATAMFSWAFQTSVRNGDLPPAFQGYVDRAVPGLLKCTNQDGAIGQSSWESGGPGHYPKIFGPQPFAQGLTTAAIALNAGRLDSEK